MPCCSRVVVNWMKLGAGSKRKALGTTDSRTCSDDPRAERLFFKKPTVGIIPGPRDGTGQGWCRFDRTGPERLTFWRHET